MVSGTGSQSHTKWAGWLSLTLSHTLLFISHQHQHMALVGNFILKMFLLMTMTWSLKIALTICVKMTYSDSDTKNLQPQSCGIFNIYWYLSASWCTTTTTWTTTTTLAGYKSTSTVQDIFTNYVTALLLSMYTFYTWGFLSTPTSLWYSSLHL